MNLETEIWKIIDGKIIELKIEEDTIFVRKEPSGIISKPVITKKNNDGGNGGPLVFKRKPKAYKRNTKMTYLEKWIRNGVFDVFTLDQFFKAYPKQRENRRLDGIISRLIADKKISQLGKDKFKVNGGC